MTAVVALQPRLGGFALVSLTLVALLGWIVAWYWPTAEQVVSIWLRSDTFAHGMVVLPVFAWLLWRKREAIAPLRPQPTPWAALPVAVCGLAWLLGRMVNVDGLTHFALIAMIVFAFAGVLGWRLSRMLLFPLAFLFFMLPIGEFLLPVMMHYTAEFTVYALRLTGVPVYHEGLFFTLPNSRWSVVEACSGLRYLIASLFVGALYAYLNYRSFRRRAIFMLIALVVPIVANWLRAYLTVMVGYHFGSEFVEGFIHIVYGWVFFGIVILIMFGIGALWQEAPALIESGRDSHRDAVPMSAARNALAALPVVALIAFFPPLLAAIERPVQPFVIDIAAPEAAPGWQRVDEAEAVFGFLPAFEGFRGELFETYRRDSDGAVVAVYVAYYALQREHAELVAWENQLAGRERARGWSQMSRVRDTSLAVAPAIHATVRGRGSERLAVWHWYWTNRSVVVSDVRAKLYLALDHITGQPDDAAFVAVYAPYVDRADEANEPVAEFLAAHAAALESSLRSAEVAR